MTMENNKHLNNEKELISARKDIFNKLKTLFKDDADEGHVFGSIARGDADAYSDIDIWFTFKDDDFEKIYINRFEYYQKLGDVIHSCEAPQNAPINGVHSALLVLTNKIITVVDIYLCPLSTSLITKESKKLFGIDLPLGEISLNPQKVKVDENYRIDFFIGFIFGTMKKLARKEQEPLKGLLREYNHLKSKYNIQVDELDNNTQTFNTLERVITNTEKIANKKQKETLSIIKEFYNKLFG